MLSQLESTKNFAAKLIESNPNLTVLDAFSDEATSASVHPFRKRQNGRIIDSLLRDGDHVVFSTLDRGFRSIQDLAETLPLWAKRGVEVHFVMDGISMSDPNGRMIANIICMFAQFEADIASERAKDSRAQLASKGRFVGGREPPFWRVIRCAGKKRLSLDRRKIVAFRLINCYRFTGLTKKAAIEKCEALFAAREGRPAIPISGVHPTTKIAAMLPDTYPRDRTGKAFPIYTVDSYDTAARVYPQALADWKKVVDARKRLAWAKFEDVITGDAN